jgi:hypothetical protein
VSTTNEWTRRELLAAGIALGVAPLDSLRSLGAQQQGGARSIADFFGEFTDDWVRRDPDLATSTRYFTGAE